MMMLHKLATPFLPSVIDCVVKKHSIYLGF